jgi:hypothetical protein
MGAEAPAGRWTLHIRLPRAADVHVLRDGAVLARAAGDTLEVPVSEAGVMRVEARIGGRLWLLSNPIHLR